MRAARPAGSTPLRVEDSAGQWKALPAPILLLDVNTLLALGWSEHEAHTAVVRRLGEAIAWATCPITQLGFVRLSATAGIFSRTLTPAQAQAALSALCTDTHHHHVAQHPSVMDCDFAALNGPRQTTDAYLLTLAERQGMRLLTLDKRLAQAFPNAAHELLVSDSA